MAKISVIIPTYNRLKTLPRALESVFNQTHPADEIIVVDDGSTDDTGPWLVQQQKKTSNTQPSSLQWLRQENAGVSAARNLAIKNAQGDWLAFLDSDDEWLPEKLKTQLAWAAKHPEHKVIHGEEIWIRGGQRVNPRRKHQKSGGWIFERCLPLCLISPSAVIIHKSVFEHIGLFDEDYPVCEDYDLWLKITANYEVGFIKDPIIKKYGGHSDQLSRKFFAMDYWRIKSLYRILESPSLGTKLGEEEFESIKNTIAEKSKILLAGYVKHQNLKNYEEVKTLSQKAQAFSAANKALNL